LYHPHAKSFLITEAVRGEGGLLKLSGGRRFMPDHDSRAELAPRDIVARAIDYEMKTRSRLWPISIFLKPAEFLKSHFRTSTRCLELGIDITQQPIPVVPAVTIAAGIMTVNGRTDVAGLYAIGEVAFTGLHGANRLASNSLLESRLARAAARIS
jgi:L-aspartate oxidase